MSTKIYIQFLTSENQLSQQEIKSLKEIIQKHAKKAGLVLGVPLINITVYSNPNFVTPETGEGGYTPSKDWIHIYIDTKRKKNELSKIINNIIPATIYHEMNHASRWQYTGYGISLMDAIVTEGLASVFAEEKWSGFKAPWCNFSEKELEKLLSIARKRNKNNDKKYNHDEWFYGTVKIPRWAGYKLGSYLVKSFRKNNKNIKWKELLKMGTKEIMKKGGINLK